MSIQHVKLAKRLLAGACTVAATVALAACGSPAAPSASAPPAGSDTPAASAPTGQIVVGLITKTETNPFFVKMRQGATEEADKLGVKLMTGAGAKDGDNEGQVTAIQNMVAAGAKGILITPNDSKGIVPTIQAARDKGVVVIALDTALDPADASDALFATNNFQAGVLIGQWAAKAMAGKNLVIATLDGEPGVTVSAQRHNGFLTGMGLATGLTETQTDLGQAKEVVCSGDSNGDQTLGQTVMENCLAKNPNINLVYTINEPSGFGAQTALKNAGKDKDVTIVTVDGSCKGVQGVKDGVFAANSMQYPLKMASMGVQAIVDAVKGGKKPSGYTDTGVTLITDKAQTGLDSKDSAFGASNCWGTVS